MDQIIIFSIIVGFFVVKELLFPEPYKAVRKQLHLLGQELGVEEKALKPLESKENDNRHFRHTINIWVEGRKLVVHQYRTTESGDGGEYWKLKIAWRYNNPHKIRFEVKPEHFWTKVKQKLGKKDLEVFSEPFDELFQIDTNNRLFVLSKFSDAFCQGLVDNHGKTGIVEAKANELCYTEYTKIKSPKVRQRVNRLIRLLRPLADDVETWNPKLIGEEPLT